MMNIKYLYDFLSVFNYLAAYFIILIKCLKVEHQIAIEKLNQEKQKIMDDVETLTKKNEKLEENSSLKDEEIDNLRNYLNKDNI